MTNILELIIAETKNIIEAKGEPCPELFLETEFLTQIQMDSLDLATLIVTLEMSLNIDPFRDGFKEFHTISELVALYENAA